MILGYYDSPLDLRSLRQRYPTSLSGTNLKGLVELATALGLSARAYRAEIQELSQVRLPAILHWNFNHFVVLVATNKQGAEILDPAAGTTRVSYAELSSRYTGVVLELEPATALDTGTPTPRVRLTSLWRDLRGVRSAAVQVLALTCALSAMTFFAPLQIQLVVDGAIAAGSPYLIPIVAGAFIICAIIQFGLEFTRTWIIQYYGSQLSYEAAGSVFRHLVRLPIDFFERRRVGEIISRFQGVGQINDIILSGLVGAIIDSALVVVALFIIVAYSPWLAGLVVLSVLIAAASSVSMQSRINQLVDTSMTERSHEQSVLLETVRGMLPIKLNGREGEREALWRNQFAKELSAAFMLARARSTQTQIGGFIGNASTVVILAAGAYLVIGGQLTLGMLMAALTYRAIVADRMMGLLNVYSQYQTVTVLLERLADIVGTAPDTSECAPLATELRGEIRLNNVSFRYGATDRPALKEVSLAIRPGEYVAIVGPSGAGKSTLLKLILGLYVPTSGDIELDGVSATPELWRTWRRRVGLVSQEDHLAAGTIADNINFFSADIDQHQLHAAARTAQVHDEIMRMPMNYQSLIGELGAALSSGQKQRILLARAFYNDPQVLVLDEGTANLDADNEDKIVEIVSGLAITRIIVSHRPALVRRADRVFDVRDGVVRERSLADALKMLATTPVAKATAR